MEIKMKLIRSLGMTFQNNIEKDKTMEVIIGVTEDKKFTKKIKIFNQGMMTTGTKWATMKSGINEEKMKEVGLTIETALLKLRDELIPNMTKKGFSYCPELETKDRY
jgi:hypothetical protein